MADIDILKRIGLGENQTLNIVNGISGQLKYSIKCVDRYLQKGNNADIFKAIWKDGPSGPTVIAIKLHKIATTESVHIAHAIYRWKREMQAHKRLKYISFQSRD